MQSPNFAMLKPEEVQMFSQRALPVVDPLVAGNELLSILYPLLQQSSNNLMTALGASRVNKYTAQIVDADYERDKLFVGLKNYVTGLTNHPDPALAQAAQAVAALIEIRGTTLYAFGYAEESSQLNGLLEDFKKPEAKQKLTAINADFWIEALAKAQQEFEALYQEKVATTAAQNIPNVHTAKRELVRNLTRLLEYIETSAAINPAKYQPVAEKLDAIIVDIMTVAHTRKTKSKKTKTPPETA